MGVYDTFPYRQPRWSQGLQIFELDHPLTSSDKRERLLKAQIEIPSNCHPIAIDLAAPKWFESLLSQPSFTKDHLSFYSLLGLSYYLTTDDFKDLIMTIGELAPKGSSIIFDYPDENSLTNQAGERAMKQKLMAERSGEKMVASYSFEAMEKMLESFGFLVDEHLTPVEITNQYFNTYNQENSQSPMTAFDNVNYCLTVKG